MNELGKPSDDVLSPDAREILRVWGGDGALHVSMRRDAWEDPAAWGLVIADLLHHVAQSLTRIADKDRSELLHVLHASYEINLGKESARNPAHSVAVADVQKSALSAPDVARLSSRHLEILRVFSNSEALTFVLRHNLWKEPAHWGVFAADLTRSVSQAFAPNGLDESEELISRIRAINRAEMDNRGI